MDVLVLNSGSSSLKYRLFAAETEEVLAQGLVERIGIAGGLGKICHIGQDQKKYEAEKAITNHQQALQMVLDLLIDPEWGVIEDLSEIKGVGHRVLHGGEVFKESVLVTADTLEQLESLKELGPLHMPANIGNRACQELCEHQVAVFDHGFPRSNATEGISLCLMRYRATPGAEWLSRTSHRYVSARVGLWPGAGNLKMITAHWE